MVMMISKFHRMIQSKIVWMIILALIIIAFVGLYVQQSFTAGRDISNAAGELNGEMITRQEFHQSYRNMYLAFSMMMGRPLEVNNQVDEQLRREAWKRVAALREADNLGVTVSAEEVVGAIQNDPMFQYEGRFSRPAYDAFLQRFLRPMGFSGAAFEQYVREEIGLQKLRQMLAQGLLVSPSELQRTFKALTDRFEVEYVTLSASNLTDEITVTEQDARSFFLANSVRFTLPEQVRVKYVAFPIDAYLEGIEITDEEALTYYDDNIDDFVVAKAEVEVVEEDEILEGEEVEYKPFDEVRAEIVERIQRDQARMQAAERATDMVVALAPDRQGKAPPFEQVAADFGVEVRTADPFALRQPIEGIDAGLAFNAAAFRLNRNPDEYFSDAIAGESTVYVLALEEKIPPRVPSFEEIEEDVFEAAKREKEAEALDVLATRLAEETEAALSDGKTFAGVARSHGLNPIAVEEFAVSAGMPTNDPMVEIILTTVLTHNAGELSQLIPIDEGYVLSYVASRKPGDMSLFGELQPQIVQSVRRQRGQIMFDEWKNHLLRSGRFRDLLAPTRGEDDDEIDESGFGEVEEES